jgi:mono/diheme cytochrome c family protein
MRKGEEDPDQLTVGEHLEYGRMTVLHGLPGRGGELARGRAVGFLDRINEHGLDLVAVNQRDPDLWLADPPSGDAIGLHLGRRALEQGTAGVAD